MTPQQIEGARIILANPEAFCSLLADARTYRILGWWDGDAHRRHPVGFHKDGLIFTNYWNLDRGCDIRAMKKPDEPLGVWCKNPAADGDPHPRPKSGTVTVWSNGRWLHEGPWVAKAERVIVELARATFDAREKHEAEREAESMQKNAAHFDQMAALRAAHTEPTP